MMNIYEKTNVIKQELLKANLKKSGYNKFSNFSYYELADITPVIIKLCNKYGILTHITFMENCARLELINIEKPEEYLVYESPMKDITIKGANEIQALGGVETYQRRYLYMMAFDIIESDMFDATAGMTEEDRAKAYTFGRGKCQGKTILEVFESDPKYLQWCLDNGKNEEVKGYIELLTELKRTEVPETEEEQNEKLILINKFNFVSDEQKDEIFKKYNVTASKDLTLEQLREIFI